ncbi:MAG: alpha/beta hydrolase [Betaproteobacteria bacterium]
MRASRLLGLILVAWATGAAAGDAPARADGRFVEVRGARLFVEVQGSGPPVVFLHGGLDHFDTAFAAQRDVFAASHRVIGIDQRGHGHSPDDARPFDYREMAEDTAAVIEALGLGPVDVVGQSDGADIAMLLARDHPALVRRLVLASGNLRAALSADELAQRKTWSEEQIDARLHKLSDSLPPRFQPQHVAATPDGPQHWWVLLRKSWQLWLTPAVVTPAELARVKAPSLVIAGDHDFVSIEETVEIWRALPHAQLLILPDTGHGTLQTRPDVVNRIVEDFLKAPTAAP